MSKTIDQIEFEHDALVFLNMRFKGKSFEEAQVCAREDINEAEMYEKVPDSE